MRGKQNFEVVLRYDEVDQVPLVVMQRYMEAEVERLNAQRPAIFGRIRFHEIKELARGQDPVDVYGEAEPLR